MSNTTDKNLSQRTFGNENSLPRVPLPTLEQSCARFLEWCSPLLSGAELEATKAAVAAYLRPESAAHALQQALKSYNERDDVYSWLDTFWPSRYLGRRDRIALNANFFFLFKQTNEGQVERAAGLIAAALNYKLLLDNELIPPVVQRGQPLSMEQNKYLFSATRIPGATQDTVRVPYSQEWPGPSDANHILVFYRGHMFRMTVCGPDKRPHTLEELEAGLRAIMNAPETHAAPTSVGPLTTKARAEWASSRRNLLECSPDNAALLDDVERALFSICLEHQRLRDDRGACDQLLHGDSYNRWFDKAVSLIVFGDGQAGINVEHCGLDGTTILSFVDAMFAQPAAAQSAQSGAVSQGAPTFSRIEFRLNQALREDVSAAARAFAEYAENNASQTLSFTNFGSNRAKELRISPDAFVQMAYQLAHKRAKGFVGATYESIATRQYNRGRTEAMRVITPEVHRFVAAMEDPAADTAQKLSALRAAADAHVARAKQCQAGDAPEQHLWELQLIQKRGGTELAAGSPLALYDSPGWIKMRNDYLSTSSAPSHNILYFGFGSTSSQCIGVGYVLLPDRFNVYLSTPRAVADQMTLFADQLKRAIGELEQLLTNHT